MFGSTPEVFGSNFDLADPASSVRWRPRLTSDVQGDALPEQCEQCDVQHETDEKKTKKATPLSLMTNMAMLLLH